MEKKTMRPTNNNHYLPLLLLSLFSSFLHPAAALCHPRNDSHFFLHPSLLVLSPTSPSPPPPSTPPPSPPPPPSPTTPPPSPQPPKQAPAPPPPSPTTPPPSPQPPSPKQAPATPPPSTTATPSLPSIADVIIPAATKAICARTTYPDLCTSSIQPLLPIIGGSGNVGLSSVLELLMKATKNQTQLAMAEFSKFAENPSTGSALAATLKDCKDKYSDSLDNFDTALTALAAKDIYTVQTDLSAVLQDYESCTGGDAPEDPTPVFPEPLKKYSDALPKLTDNCLDLCTFLK